jgi:hypothetical protein
VGQIDMGEKPIFQWTDPEGMPIREHRDPFKALVVGADSVFILATLTAFLKDAGWWWFV